MMFTFNEERHEYLMDGIRVPSLTQMLEADGWSSHLYSAPPQVVLDKQRWGTQLHAALLRAEYGEGVTESFKQHCVDWLDMCRRMKWGYPSFPIWKKAEVPVLWRDEGFAFAFTPDRAAPECVVELKGTYSPHPGHSIQTALQVIGMGYDRKTLRYIAYFDKAGMKKLHLCGPTVQREGKTLDVFAEADRIIFEYALSMEAA